jgi:polyhydroxybutyrate depolymerase
MRAMVLVFFGACTVTPHGLDGADAPARPEAAPPDAAGGGPPIVVLPDAGPPDPGTADAATVGDTLSRPYHFRAPAAYDPARAWPLVIMLHGYSATGPEEELYLNFGRLVDVDGFLYAFPDGLTDVTGFHFWNATDGCCDFYGNPVDDVAYIDSVIDDVSARYHVDTKRIYVLGHSNGGFMAYRLACDLAPRIAAIVSLSGAMWNDAAKCTPAAPVSVLDIHGKLDPIVLYGGGRIILASAPYPPARTSVADWAGFDHCAAGPTDEGRINLDAVILGDETEVAGYSDCDAGTEVREWSIDLGGHVPIWNATAMPQIWEFMAAHPKQ